MRYLGDRVRRATTLDANSLQAGDHLWIWLGGYSHHGLYLGDGRVAHYAGWVDGLRAGPLEVTDLADFRRGRRLHRRNHPRRRYSRAESVARVLARVGERSYSVHANNCEHLCYWAIEGQQRSRQLDWVDAGLGVIHPALEATRRGLAARPGPVSRQAGPIIGQLVLDWGVKSAARWVAGPYGLAAYASYRLGRFWLEQRRH